MINTTSKQNEKLTVRRGLLKILISFCLMVVGILILTFATTQLSHAAGGGANQVPRMPDPGSNVYTYLYDYDNNIGAAGAQCYPAPPTIPYLTTGATYWGSLASDPSIDTINVNSSTTLPISLAINSISENCNRNWSDFGVSGALFPADTNTPIPGQAYTSNFGFLNAQGKPVAPQPSVFAGNFSVYTSLSAVDSVTGLPAGSATLAKPTVDSQGSLYVDPAGYISTKYFLSKKVPFDYTPTGGKFTSSDSINIYAKAYEINQFCAPADWDSLTATCKNMTIDCVSGWQNPADGTKTWSVLSVLGYPGGEDQFLIDKCNQIYVGVPLFTINVVIPPTNVCPPSTALTGSTIVFNAPGTFTETNTGTSAWSGSYDHLDVSLNGPDYQDQTDAIYPYSVLVGQQSTFAPVSFTPSVAGNYQIIADMWGQNLDANGSPVKDAKGNIIPAGYLSASPSSITCTVTVRNVFNYIPTISITGTSGAQVNPTSSLPADSAAVTPGETIDLQALVKNEVMPGITSSPNGDQYNTWIDSYSGPYTYSANPTVVFGPDTQVATGIGYGGVPVGTTASNILKGTYVVPPGTPDGTQICFYAGVSPAQRKDYTSGAFSINSAFSNYSGSTPDDPNANIYSSLVNGVQTSNDMCVEVENIRTLGIAVTQGDVHAGGGVGGSCSLGPNSTGITGDSGSYSQYVASSNAAITGLPTGSNATITSNALTLGNVNPGSLGAYGIICRPDMVASANNYIRLNGSSGSLSGNVDLSTLTKGIYTTKGAVYLSGQVNAPITIYDLNGFGVTVSGNITYSSTPVGINSLPSFGVITNGGDINFSNAASQIDGFYVAQKNNNSGGLINTCIEHTLGNTFDCPNTLTVLGSLTANSFDFYRTSNSTFQSGNLITETIQQSGLLYLAPPPAFAIQPGTSASLPQYLGEYPPLY